MVHKIAWGTREALIDAEELDKRVALGRDTFTYLIFNNLRAIAGKPHRAITLPKLLAITYG